jgi:hypothetical protein
MGLTRRLLSRVTASKAVEPATIRFSDLSETPSPDLLPPLHRPDVDEATPTAEQRAWRHDGEVVLPKFLPASVIDPYVTRRARLAAPDGWLSPAPYRQVPELRMALDRFDPASGPFE